MTTTLSIRPIHLPLTLDAHGMARVGGTRVTLDTVVRAFLKGATAEEIAHQYPSLKLSDIYAIIGYYLEHRKDVDTYLKNREKESQSVKRENQTKFDPSGIRDRLLSRKSQTK
ncbi:MAG: hypothetical protein A2Z03_10620 [Chloroflexi bacterium RBG_16_56_8]|nr:MAG: hypothetical protein A2Z03_10620 [Chloroflexi bacterium RBG_16_56_8]